MNESREKIRAHGLILSLNSLPWSMNEVVALRSQAHNYESQFILGVNSIRCFPVFFVHY